MSKLLSAEAIAQYRRDGYCAPIPAMSPDEVREARAGLEAFEACNGGALAGAYRFKTHLLFKWLSDLARAPHILDAVEDLMGPDIMLWTTNWFIKEARSEQYISWHQDSNYWGLDTRRLVSVWVALSLAAKESGCMRIIPGSHTWPDQPHHETFADDNMLTRGQEIRGLDESQAVDLEVATGQAAVFTYRLLHSSSPNRSGDRRIAAVLRYMPPETRQTLSDWDSAALVRGRDRFGHFEHEPIPAADFDPVAVAFHKRAEEAQRAIYYKDTDWREHRT